MRHTLVTALFILAGLFPGVAWAGAWTLDRGRTQIITGVTISSASRSFDKTGKPTIETSFDKLFVQSHLEYGLTDAVTLFVAPEHVTAQSQFGSEPITEARDTAVEAGARVLLPTSIGMLSLQGSVKTAGAFGMSVSANQASGRQLELRLLYGKDYQLFGDDGFVDLQIAERWISRPRPNEMTIDATSGLCLTPATLVMLKSFNTISEGGGEVPYTFYRQHKLELSLVQRITDVWSLQVGAFISPAGQNTIVEQGISTSIWVRF